MRAVTAERTALVLLDLQPFILGALDDSDGVLGAARRALDVARRTGVTCIHVRVAFTPEDHAGVPEAHPIFAGLAAAGGAAEGSAETALAEAVAAADGEAVLTKTRVSAFTRTDLDDTLRVNGIDTLVVAGVVTSGAVLSTVLEASDRDYRVLVVADACADFDPELHASLRGSLLERYAEVVDVATLEGMLGA